ncbi:MAG: tetratricopeptide repeat protein [Deltaproteobacteria bacterium]|mgnify:CR=1 FL=1|nr:tetratricopeptide repeat protein [Deltaproteobacteria bacterium]
MKLQSIAKSGLTSTIRVLLLFAATCCQAQTPPSHTNNEITLPEREAFPATLQNAFDLFKAGKQDQTLAELRRLKSTKEGRKVPDSLFLLEGLVYQKRGEDEKAAKAFENSLFYRGSNSDVIYQLALIRKHQNQIDEAKRCLKEAIWFNRFVTEKREAALFQLGVLHELSDQKADAEKAFRTALQTNPNYLPAKAKLADLVFESGDQNAAIAMLRQAINKDPENLQLKIKLAGALLSGADRTLNEKDVEESLSLTTAIAAKIPPQDLATNPVFPLHLRALVANDKLPQAEKLLEQALTKAPNDPQLATLKKQLEIEKTAAARAPKTAKPSAKAGDVPPK